MSTCPECFDDTGCTCDEMKRITELESELAEAVSIIRQGKARFSPHTTNSDVDVFLAKYDKKGGGK